MCIFTHRLTAQSHATALLTFHRKPVLKMHAPLGKIGLGTAVPPFNCRGHHHCRNRLALSCAP